MSSSWFSSSNNRNSRSKEVPRPKTHLLEDKVLHYSGLKLNEDLFVYDVPIEINGKTHKVHTYRCGDANKESLVLLHGYAGSSALYYHMLKPLSTKFRVYCIDFVGMGLSSKDKFECKSTEETIEFLVGSIEKWRQAVGIEKFTLAGHSFGGYIAGQYALHHQANLKKLILLSPVGFTHHEQEYTAEDIAKNLGWFQGKLYLYFMKMWKSRITPCGFVKKHPIIGKYIIKRYSHGEFRLQDQEAETVKDFLFEMLSQDPGSEEAIHYILKPPVAVAYMPLENIIADLKVTVDCFFGQFDYMDMDGAIRIHNSRRKRNFHLKTVPDAAHQITMQNPQFLADQIILGAGL